MWKADVIRRYSNASQAAKALSAIGISLTRQAIHAWPDLVPELTARRINDAEVGIPFNPDLYLVK